MINPPQLELDQATDEYKRLTRLYQRCILQHLEDLFLDPSDIIHKSAKNWIFSTHKNYMLSFETTCDYAGWAASDILTIANRILSDDLTKSNYLTLKEGA